MAEYEKTFRIFVSSTFSDFKEERSALQNRVFPKIRELCMQNGCRFQAVDLRWGVSDEASLDQQTMKICLEEIKRSQAISPRPNFIVFSGDRYGWRPLPWEIPLDEYNEILKHIDSDTKSLLNTWYRLDDNAVPPLYCLQPRTGKYVENKKWKEVEYRLRIALNKAVSASAFSQAQELKYTASATEQEITIGALNVDDAQKHVFCFFRKIEGLPCSENAGDYLDMTDKGLIDTEAGKLLHILKYDKLEKSLPDNIYKYNVKWKDNCIQYGDHLDLLCRNVEERLSKVILKEISETKNISPLEKEIEAHKIFQEERLKNFIGRDHILKKIEACFSDIYFPFHEYTSKGRILALHGESGSGKSALIAKSIKDIENKYPGCEIVYRFISLTPDSSNIVLLLRSICSQIAGKYGSLIDIPYKYGELIECFFKCLSLASLEKPLGIFIDALDQLSDEEYARNLSWLFGKLPDYVIIIVSSTPGECLQVLTNKLQPENIIKLDYMMLEDSESLLDLWLKDSKRTLQPFQRTEILNKFKNCRLPLYLKLAFEEARRWHSYDSPAPVGKDIRSIINNLFDRLSDRKNHGSQLVSKSLGYLAASRIGLTEDELLDILSCDSELMNDFKERTYNKLSERRLPVVVWSRLYFDLKPYLTVLNSGGLLLYGFYHRQFGEAAADRYCKSVDVLYYHQRLAEYFSQSALWNATGKKPIPNHRKVSELPYHLACGKMIKELENLLADVDFVIAKIMAGMVYDLVYDYGRIDIKTQLGSFVRQEAYILRKHPEQVFELILNHSPDLYNEISNTDSFKRLAAQKKYIKRMVNSSGKPHITLTISANDNIITWCRYMPDGKRIITTFSSGDLVYFDAETGREISKNPIGNYISEVSLIQLRNGQVLGCYSNRKSINIFNMDNGQIIHKFIEGRVSPDRLLSCFSPDGRRILFTCEKYVDIVYSLRVCDVESGAAVFDIRSSHYIYTCAFSPDGKRIVTGGGTFELGYNEYGTYGPLNGKGIIEIWDVRTGRKSLSWTGHSNIIVSCGYSPDGKQILTGSNDGVIKIWDAKSGTELFLLSRNDIVKKSIGLHKCMYSPDGSLVAANTTSDIGFWSKETGEYKFTLGDFGGSINDFCFSPDGRKISAVVRTNSGYIISICDIGTGNSSSCNKSYGTVMDCTFSPDGEKLAAITDFASLTIWDAATHDIINSYNELDFSKDDSKPNSLCRYSQDGSMIIYGGSCRVERVKEDNGDLKSIPLWGRLRVLKAEALYRKPSGNSIFALPSGYINLYSTKYEYDRKYGDELAVHTGHIKDMAFSPDGRYMLTASTDETLKYWDTSVILRELGKTNEPLYAKELYTLAGHTGEVLACDISPDGTSALSGSGDKTLRVWDLKTGKESLKINTVAAVNSCRYSPDGMHAVAGLSDGTVIIWDMREGKSILDINYNKSYIFDCLYSFDGQYVISFSEGTLWIWDLRLNEIAAKFYNEGTIFNISQSKGSMRLAFGDTQENMDFYVPVNIEFGPPIVTLTYLYRFDTKSHDENITAKCEWCGKRFTPDNGIISSIKQIMGQIKADQSPCIVLSDENFCRQDLVATCPFCHKPLKFNPFIIDNCDRKTKDIIDADMLKKISEIEKEFGINKSDNLSAKTLVNNPPQIAMEAPSGKNTEKPQISSAEKELRLLVQYQKDLRKWKALPFWKRIFVDEPKRPQSS